MVDATTQAALEAQVLYWRVLIYADIDGDPIRLTSGVYDKIISSSGDAELDGTYESYAHDLLEVGEVKHNENGSDTLGVTMNGILPNLEYVFDRFDNIIYDRDGNPLAVRGSSLLSIIGDKSRWQGRLARLWFYCVDENENQVGSIIPYYTGYMNEVSIAGDPLAQKIMLKIENYLVTLSNASNKTYLQQNLFDPDDLSADAAIAAANGMDGAGLIAFNAATFEYGNINVGIY
jgi:hypothetical protein